MSDPQQHDESARAGDTASDTKGSPGAKSGDSSARLKEEVTTAEKVRSILELGNTADNLTNLVNPKASQPTPQSTVGSADAGSVNQDELKWERDVFRDVLSNVNQTLRFQIQLAVPLLAGCVTVLNIVPPQVHQELLNDLDRWVFIPVLISAAVAYRGLEFHWYSNTHRTKLSQDIQELYQLVKYKHRMVKIAILLQALGLVLLMVFVLLEYK